MFEDSMILCCCVWREEHHFLSVIGQNETLGVNCINNGLCGLLSNTQIIVMGKSKSLEKNCHKVYKN